MSEFDLIAKYFTRPADCTDLSIGDDAALVRVREGHQLAISTDMLVAGTHFFHDADAYQLGWKSLAVNVSDMAAMGATPKWTTLAIALPEVNEVWLAEFSRGFFACADAFNIDLIGGDTTRGPLTISVQIMGEVPTHQALRRDGAKAGDDIWVSGQLGNAALGLAYWQNKITLEGVLGSAQLEICLSTLHAPQPRVALGLALINLAHSAIDISDGLLADLGHILECAKVGAEIHLKDIPCAAYIKNHLHEKLMQQCVLVGGDDYELCFTAPSNQREMIKQLSQKLDLRLTCIGRVTAEAGLILYGLNNEVLTLASTGYNHFA